MLQLFQDMPYREELPARTGHFNWSKLWLAFCFANAMLPLCALYTWAHPKIRWSGITYKKAKGRIVAVEHPDKSDLTEIFHFGNDI